MVKSVLGVNHQGLRDWFAQRVTAIIMAIYLAGLVIFYIAHTPLTYTDWRELFSHFWMKIGTVFVFLSLFYHAWVGMWTVYTDYIKWRGLGIVLNVATFLVLIAFFLAVLQIVWSV